jgi:4-hydroxybenzoate polyprenyltransferase
MGDILSAMQGVLKFTLTGPLGLLLRFAYWFYLKVIPFVLQYIAIPMFALGILMALAFAGGTVLFTIIFFIAMYFFIKGTIFNSNPKLK